MTAAKACVQYYAVNEENISMANVSAILDGKAKNVLYGMTNVRSLIAMVTATVSMANALVSEATKASFALILTALIQLVPAMDSASKARVFARRAGKALTVQQWIRMLCNVFRTALDMAHSMLTPKPVLVTLVGLVMTVPKRSVILIVVYTEDVSANLVYAIPVGLASSVPLSYVTPAAVTTVNVKMALVSACLVGTVGIAHWKVVRGDAPDTGSVRSPMMASGPANVSMDGTVRIVRRSKNRSVMIQRIMTKMASWIAKILSAASTLSAKAVSSASLHRSLLIFSLGSNLQPSLHLSSNG